MPSHRVEPEQPTPGRLTLSLPLLDWLRAGPDWSQRPWQERVTLAWQARWGSWNARLSAATSAEVHAPLADPMLILGPWRSGTTVMHELIAAASGYPTPATWQCMNACAFALRGRPSRAAQSVPRPMDGLTIDALSPQEDEFALLSLGVASVYRAFLAPARLGEAQAWLEQDYWLSHPEWVTVWEQFLLGVLRFAPKAQTHLPLLLKSPNHTFRLQAIVHRFPGARVVWMARDAAAVFHSNRKMWRQMFQTYGGPHHMPSDAALDSFLARALGEAADALAWCLSHLPSAQLAIVDHGSLADSPQRALQPLRTRWGDDWQGGNDALDRAMAATRTGRVDRYAQPLPDQALDAVRRLNEQQTLALRAVE